MIPTPLPDEPPLDAVGEIKSIVHEVIQKVWAPTPPPPSETKLTELLDEMEKYGFSDLPLSASRIGKVKHCRSSLESLYKELQDANDELETTVDLRYQEVLAGLRAELSALRSLQLTPEELEHVRTNWRPVALCQTCRDVIEKLDSISSKATSEEL